MSQPHTFIEYVHGKVVERIVFVNDTDHRELDIQFQDKTGFHVRLDVRLEVEAIELLDWKDGEGKLIHKFL
jgi:hypothetical protein